MTDDIRAAVLEDMSDDDLFIAELSDADSSIWSAASYLTPDGLVVSIAVKHVLGDHMEISLSYDDLAPFKTDNPVWAAVGG
jgi:hypothetical protein